MTTDIATLGGGCFWCLEAAFSALSGIHKLVSGYSGGFTDRPTYEQVCSGETGHAEVVRIEFDPTLLDYRTLLSIFFVIHDPSTLNRQGYDVGTQYRSVIFTHSETQADIARSLIAELDAAQSRAAPIVTAVLPASTFWPAEPYHQDYFARNPSQAYCRAVIPPKLSKLREAFAARLKSS